MVLSEYHFLEALFKLFLVKRNSQGESLVIRFRYERWVMLEHEVIWGNFGILVVAVRSLF